MQTISFGADNIENELARMTLDQLDDLAFGAVQVDGKGRILLYNAAEGAITGRSPQEVIGKNFFEDIAPCTNEHGFRDKFDEGVQKGVLNTLVDWTFDNAMTPTRVQVHMKKAAQSDRYWIFVKRV